MTFSFDPDLVSRDQLTPDTQQIWDVIGKEATLKLMEALGGLKLHITSQSTLERAQRHAAVMELLEGGSALHEVVRETGMPARYVLEIQRTLRKVA